MVEAGADIEASAYDGFRPLHVAALHGHVEVVTTLVELGADIDAWLERHLCSLASNKVTIRWRGC